MEYARHTSSPSAVTLSSSTSVTRERYVKDGVKPRCDIVSRRKTLKPIVESMGGIKVIKRIPNGIGYKGGVSK
jgi:hypothetical protein